MPYSYDLAGGGSGPIPSYIQYPETIVVANGTPASWYWPKGAHNTQNNYWSPYAVGMVPLRFNTGMDVVGFGTFLWTAVDQASISSQTDGSHTATGQLIRSFIYEADTLNRPKNLVADLGYIYFPGYDNGGPGNGSALTADSSSVYLQPNKLYYLGAKASLIDNDGNDIYTDAFLASYSIFNNAGIGPTANAALYADVETISFNPYGFNGYYANSIANTNITQSLPATLGAYGDDIYSSSYPMSIYVKAVID